MKTTAESTFSYQAALEWSVPGRWAPQLRADLDELQAYRAQQTTAPAHARQCRTDAIETLVMYALEHAELNAAVMEALPCFRTSMVIGHLNYHREDHGDVKKRYDIKKAPCPKKVREVLRRHGYM